jgi:hypothetical protein
MRTIILPRGEQIPRIFNRRANGDVFGPERDTEFLDAAV